jgi:exodeoxyribonuclease VII small subunit
LKTKPSKEPRFEESLQKLEALVQEMEAGDMALEEIIKKYEEGSRLVKFCTAKLSEAEKRIEVLMREKDGSLSLQPVGSASPDDSGDSESEEEEGNKTESGTELF